MKLINEIKPYTYLVKFKPTGKVYYGSRCQNFTKFNRSPADDFWHRYTTSSENINALIEEHGKDAFEYEIRRTFDSVEEMAEWETRVLTRCKVLERQDIWMNGNIAGYKILTEAGARKISERHKDVPKTEDHKKNLSLSQKGKPKINSKNQTPEYKEKMSLAKSGINNPMYGKPCSAERAANISAAKKGKPAKNKGYKETRPEVLEKIKLAAQNRKPQTKEQREKQAQKTRGQKRTPEQKERIRQGVLLKLSYKQKETK
jgi:hypothetical protein